jgi:hypothetical protein|uniref:Uncharacterized protein n=1 Tax=Picea glauca TaxID=3330 RepID=A0A101LUC3_PICGL|nr:hypothetical protein ABT39_MTgene2611 [Picea glauca]QHR87063.1 hypothetical protein Q903MT_gene1072 [Picea sitchensis]
MDLYLGGVLPPLLLPLSLPPSLILWVMGLEPREGKLAPDQLRME